MSRERLRRARVHVDRAPAGWLLAAGGALAQFVVASAALGHATLSGETPFAPLLLAGWSLLGAVLAAPGIAALAVGWRPRVASGALLAVGVLLLVVTAAHPPATILPAGLAVAALRGWIGASVDAVDVAAVDPDRLEAIDPGAGPDGDAEA